MSRANELHSHIGQICIGRKGETLKAILGSCVGIALIWRAKGICGLAHCLLPEDPEKRFEIGARYVTQALPSLLALMRVKPEDMHELEAVVTGGGNMFKGVADSARKDKLVGAANAKMALKMIKAAGIRLVFEDVGGDVGRRIEVDSVNGTYRVVSIPRLESVA